VKVDEEGNERKLTGLFGTPYFIAPEVFQGSEYGKSADLWSLGSTVFTLLAGVVRFSVELFFFFELLSSLSR
jgi:serine/threonine protein kinase